MNVNVYLYSLPLLAISIYHLLYIGSQSQFSSPLGLPSSVTITIPIHRSHMGPYFVLQTSHTPTNLLANQLTNVQYPMSSGFSGFSGFPPTMSLRHSPARHFENFATLSRRHFASRADPDSSSLRVLVPRRAPHKTSANAYYPLRNTLSAFPA